MNYKISAKLQTLFDNTTNDHIPKTTVINYDGRFGNKKDYIYLRIVEHP